MSIINLLKSESSQKFNDGQFGLYDLLLGNHELWHHMRIKVPIKPILLCDEVANSHFNKKHQHYYKDSYRNGQDFDLE